MFVDASAIIAVLTEEADGEQLASALDRANAVQPITSVIAVWKAVAGLCRKKLMSVAEATARVDEFLRHARIEIVPVGQKELALALQAFDRYGRHPYAGTDRNRALNLADCFHYACAKSHSVPMLHKNLGFGLTDLTNARSGQP